MTAIVFDTHSAVKRLMLKGVQEEQAEEFVNIISEINNVDMSKVASKEQVAVLEKDVENIKQSVATKADLGNVRTEVEKVRTDVEKVRTEFKAELHHTEVRLILMIGASIVATCSIILGVLKHMLQHLL